MGTGQRARLTARTAVAAVLAALVGLALGGSARSTGVPVDMDDEGVQTYLQFNLCGNACNNGQAGVVTDVHTSVTRRRPTVVLLNEVCQNQYDLLVRGLTAYAGRFDPTGPRCRNGALYGNAILIRTSEPVELISSWELPNPAADETRRLLCVRTELRGPTNRSTAVCVTHISNESGNIEAQVRTVAELLATVADNYAVVLGGDFNTDPADPRMDPLYRDCDGVGLFHEADSAGCASRRVLNERVDHDVINEATYGPHKYDYVFFSDGGWTRFAADATGSVSTLSDHNALWATAQPR